MTIEKIINFLKRKKRWLKTTEISEKTRIPITKISGCLGRLVKQGYVLRKSERSDGERYNLYKLSKLR